MIYWLYFSSNWNMYLAPRFWLWGGGNGYGHLYDAVWTLGSAPWLEFDFVYLYNEFYPIWILGTIIYINLDGKDTTYGPEGQERLWPTINGRSFGAIKSAVCNMVLFNHFKSLGIFAFAMVVQGAYYRWAMFIADDHTLNYAANEANRSNFILGMARCGPVIILSFVLTFICGNYYLYGGMIKKYMDSAKLISAEGFRSRLRKVYKSRFYFNILVVGWFLLYTFFLPQGMALQMFGISQREAWPSLVQWAFDVPGSPTNI